MLPEVTVAICVYNGAKYIGETLQCIVSQTFPAFDLLIVDDCSTDGTSRIVRDFFKCNPREYSLIGPEKNQGVAQARQMALETARTRYLIFVDADDLPHRTLVEKEYRLISSDENLMAVSCWSEYIDEAGNKIGGGLYLGDKTKDDFVSRARRGRLVFLPVQTLFDRQVALRAGGFRLDGFPGGKPRYRDFCEDLDLWTRMSDLYTEGKCMVVIPEVLYSYRKANAGLSSHTEIMLLKMRYVKANLRLRRSGQPELTFLNFQASLSEKEVKGIRKSAIAADSLRNGVFCLKKGQFGKGIAGIVRSFRNSPGYLWQKIKSNSGLFR